MARRSPLSERLSVSVPAGAPTPPAADTKRWRVLVVHGAYRERGGEDAVVESEIELLRNRGHEVQTYLRSNAELATENPLAAAVGALWSQRTVREMSSRLAQFKADIVHVHNTWPLISPSVYWASARVRVPVVQTLHNYRLGCVAATFLREGSVCEDCLGRLPWPAIAHARYRDSHVQSAVLASMLALHRRIGTWQHKVARYIALSDFARDKFIEIGLLRERIAVKPNFVDAPATPDGARRGFLFVGRLSEEKGVRILAAAVGGRSDPVLRVAGAGAQEALLAGLPAVTLVRELPQRDVLTAMSQCSALIIPSVAYENFPRVLVEAFAMAAPVIASRIGPLADLVTDGDTGLLFEPADAHDLASKLAWAERNPHEMRRMGRRARERYEALYTPASNYLQLMSIYADALAEVARPPR